MRRWQAALRFIGIGWYVGLSILGGVLAGLWLDDRFSTKPLFVIIGLLFGLLVAGYGVYKMFSLISNNKKNQGNG
ncbi:MAG TPA: AtpZ/AtpI family protein [Dehalococcoidia bacterium]|nr:AtpZ/AtpI family protein [Dehalococcoidia bacterium]